MGRYTFFATHLVALQGRDRPRDGQARHPLCDRRLLAGLQHHVPDERANHHPLGSVADPGYDTLLSNHWHEAVRIPANRVQARRQSCLASISVRRSGTSRERTAAHCRVHGVLYTTIVSGPAVYAFHRDAVYLLEQVGARRQIGIPLWKDGEVVRPLRFIRPIRAAPSSRSYGTAAGVTSPSRSRTRRSDVQAIPPMALSATTLSGLECSDEAIVQGSGASDRGCPPSPRAVRHSQCPERQAASERDRRPGRSAIAGSDVPRRAEPDRAQHEGQHHRVRDIPALRLRRRQVRRDDGLQDRSGSRHDQHELGTRPSNANGAEHRQCAQRRRPIVRTADCSKRKRRK